MRRATAGDLPGSVKVLTSCPSCLQGPARFADDTGAQADYIVVEMARSLLGEDWLAEFVRAANAGGIERIRLQGRRAAGNREAERRSGSRCGPSGYDRSMQCELCTGEGGTVLWRDAFCRVVQVDARDYPGYCRVILNRHASEMTDLAPAERERLMRAVYACEAVLRELLRPHKINLASLGNMVPHLHWHVVPRRLQDPHFPDAIWAAPRRAAPDPAVVAPQDLARALTLALGAGA